MSAVKNLQKIIGRVRALPPVIYSVEIPGDLAIKLNFLAIQGGRSVEEEILDAIECHTLFLDYE